MPKMRTVALLAFWGQYHTGQFLRFALPSMLASGNLPWLAANTDLEVRIATTEADLRSMHENELFRRACRDYRFDVTVFPDMQADANGHYAWTDWLNALIRRKKCDEVTYLFCHPDVIYSNALFKHALSCTFRGKRAVTVPVLRVSYTKIDARYPQSETQNVIDISSRDLVKIAFSTIHEVTKSSFWDSTKFTTWPSEIYFRANDSLIVGRIFHACPLLVRPRNSAASIQISVDADYVERAIESWDEVEMIADSDHGFMCSLTPDSQHNILNSVQDDNIAKTKNIVAWASHMVTALHRRYFSKTIFIHSEDLKLKDVLDQLVGIANIGEEILAALEPALPPAAEIGTPDGADAAG